MRIVFFLLLTISVANAQAIVKPRIGWEEHLCYLANKVSKSDKTDTGKQAAAKLKAAIQKLGLKCAVTDAP